MPDPYPQIIFAILLLILNALLSAGGNGIKELNRALLARKAEDGDKTAIQISKLSEQGSNFRAALRTGRALCKIGGAISVFDALLPCFDGENGALIAGLLATLIVTVAFVLFAEIFPIRVTEQTADEIVYKIWPLIRVLACVFYPIALPVNGIVSLFLRMGGLKQEAEEALSKEEIQSIVEESGDSGLLEEHEMDMLEGIFDFNEKTATAVMTPRTEVFMIDAALPLKDQLGEILSEKYSRIPVYKEEIDNIVGVLYLKDFLCEAYRVGFENVDLNNCIHEPYFVPEHKRLDDLYKELRESKNHMAILIDEFGGFSGIVTLEDLIEAVMGDIDDEYDDEEEEILSEDDGSFLADGSATIAEINDALGTELDENDEDYTTVGGLIIKLLGYLPEENELPYLEFGGCAFSVEEISERRIEKVRISKLAIDGTESESE